ncbi:hypothetical protein D9M68_19740 [compost metagenome]
MVPKISAALLRGKEDPDSRQRTLDAIEQWRRADADIERICKEKGIPVPVLTC